MKTWTRAADIGRWVLKLEADYYGRDYWALGLFLDIGRPDSRKLRLGVQLGPVSLSGECWRRAFWPNRMRVRT